MADFDLLVVGDYCLDLIFTGLPGMPEMGREIVASGFEMIPGGSYNTAVAAHRLGMRVAWACDTGTDAFSRFVLDQMVKEGLDLSLVVHHKRSLRNITVALSFPHDRAFIAYYDPGPAVPAGFRALAKASARALYLPGLYSGPLLEAGLVALRAKKMKLVMDGNSNDEISLANETIRRAVASTDLFLLNEQEAERLTGEKDPEKVLHILSKLSKLVVIKRGAQGAISIENGQVVRAAAIPANVVDTTGAGDCFNAGFLKAWLDGRPLIECLRWGNITGGLSTQARGGTSRVIRAGDVLEYLKQYA